MQHCIPYIPFCKVQNRTKSGMSRSKVGSFNFISLDDPSDVFENAAVARGLSIDGSIAAFGTSAGVGTDQRAHVVQPR